jgi:hypothetical protein
MAPSIATKFQYVNSFLFSFFLNTCFGPYGPSSGQVSKQPKFKLMMDGIQDYIQNALEVLRSTSRRVYFHSRLSNLYDTVYIRTIASYSSYIVACSFVAAGTF